MIRLKPLYIVMVSLYLIVPLKCWPQATEVDQISGTIVDTTGAAVAGAQVKATQTSTGFTRTVTTSSSGFYQIVSLPIGPYEIGVTAAGFKTSLQRVVLQVNVNPTLNLALEVGSVQQQVVVEASASMAETETAAVGQVINDKSVVDLPLNGRNPAQLVVLSGGAAQQGGFLSSKNYPSSVSISVAGGDTNGTTYLMDGGYDNDVFSAVNLPLPFPDVLQEFSVQTSSIPASYGERAGGVVNVVTKSGTNEFHGDAFEFVRNGVVNARNYFATKVDKQKRNQFGGTFGGPIVHDKLFFFGGWQGTILKTAPPTTISYTPTSQELQGDFSSISKQLVNPANGQPYQDNQIPTDSFSQASLNLMKYVPIGDSTQAGKVQYSIPSPSNENQYLARMDWDQSQRDQIFGRYYFTKDSNPAQFGGDLLLTTNAGIVDTVQMLTLGDTFTLSQKAVNNLHFTWTYEHINRGPASGVPSAASLGLIVAPSAGNSPQISVSSYFTTMCGTCSIAKVYSGAKQVADDVNYISGRHQFAFGGEWVGKYLNYTTSSQQNVAVTFNGSISGNALADFLLGVPSSFQQGNITVWNPVMNYFAFYASDSIRLTHHLNLTAGLRWEPYFPQHDTLNRASHFDVGAFAAGVTSSVYANAPAGLTYPGDKGFPVGGTYHSLAQIAPRLGLVWDVSGDAKTIVHAGYGILEDGRSDLETFDRVGFQPPWASLITLNNPAGGWANPYSAYPGGDPFPLQIPPTSTASFVAAGTYVNMPLHIRPSYYQEWNFSVQRQIGANWLVTVNYMGNEGVHLWTNYQADPAEYIPGTCGSSDCSTTGNTNSRRIFALLNPNYANAFSSMTTIGDGGTSSYNGMIVSVNRRLAQNFSMLFNYTWAHCINEQDAFVEITGTSQNPFNLAADRGNCSSDLHQIYNLSLVAGAPHMTGNAAKFLLSDWRFSGIVSGRSGFWFSPASGVDASLTGVGADRPNASGNPNDFHRTLAKWMNTADYTQIAPGTYGNAGRNSLLGPGGYEPDLAVFRDFRYQLREKPQVMELRLEAFNATNHPEFSNPSGTFTSAQFGKIQSTANNGRIMQLSFKYIF
jgi:hypothetical protein